MIRFVFNVVSVEYTRPSTRAAARVILTANITFK